jgi:hypothetical protein
MGKTNSPSVAHVGCDISPLSRVKFKFLTTRLTATREKAQYILILYRITDCSTTGSAGLKRRNNGRNDMLLSEIKTLTA